MNSAYHNKSKWRDYMCIYIQKQKSWIHIADGGYIWFDHYYIIPTTLADKHLCDFSFTQFKWEIPPKSNRTRVYMESTGLFEEGINKKLRDRRNTSSRAFFNFLNPAMPRQMFWIIILYLFADSFPILHLTQEN